MTEGGEPVREETFFKITFTLAVISFLTYCLVASSAEYADYAPVSLSTAWLYVGYVVFGATLVIVVRNWLAVVAIALVPAAIFGIALVALPDQLGLVELLGVGLHPFVTWSLQRVVIHLLFAFSLVGVGAFGGIWLREMLPY